MVIKKKARRIFDSHRGASNSRRTAGVFRFLSRADVFRQRPEPRRRRNRLRRTVRQTLPSGLCRPARTLGDIVPSRFGSLQLARLRLKSQCRRLGAFRLLRFQTLRFDGHFGFRKNGRDLDSRRTKFRRLRAIGHDGQPRSLQDVLSIYFGASLAGGRHDESFFRYRFDF